MKIPGPDYKNLDQRDIRLMLIHMDFSPNHFHEKDQKASSFSQKVF